jgi:ABC-type dipeptide/oligopeptide/nickel transport system ATPase component
MPHGNTMCRPRVRRERCSVKAYHGVATTVERMRQVAVFFNHGESGVGKSSWVHAFVESQRTSSAIVLVCAMSFEAGPPLTL